jgi:ABC-type sugar transport system ATPase subunit
VIDDELAATVEQVLEMLFAAWAVKDIVLFDLHHGKPAPPGIDAVVVLGECFLLAEERLALVSAVCQRLQVKAASIEMKTGNLSGGNQQKVVLAKWLTLSPKVLIVDEPTRGIDVGAKGEIYTLLRDLADAGVSIVMISSDMEEILHATASP